jgi:hypothetical protein
VLWSSQPLRPRRPISVLTHTFQALGLFQRVGVLPHPYFYGFHRTVRTSNVTTRDVGTKLYERGHGSIFSTSTLHFVSLLVSGLEDHALGGYTGPNPLPLIPFRWIPVFTFLLPVAGAVAMRRVMPVSIFSTRLVTLSNVRMGA